MGGGWGGEGGDCNRDTNHVPLQNQRFRLAPSTGIEMHAETSFDYVGFDLSIYLSIYISIYLSIYLTS